MRCRFDGYESAADWIQLLPIEVGHSFSYAQTAVCQCFPKAHEQDLSAPTAVDIAGMDYRRTRPQSGSESFGNRDRREILRGTRSDHEKTMQILATLDQYTGCVLSTPGPSNTGAIQHWGPPAPVTSTGAISEMTVRDDGSRILNGLAGAC